MEKLNEQLSNLHLDNQTEVSSHSRDVQNKSAETQQIQKEVETLRQEASKAKQHTNDLRELRSRNSVRTTRFNLSPMHVNLKRSLPSSSALTRRNCLQFVRNGASQDH